MTGLKKLFIRLKGLFSPTPKERKSFSFSEAQAPKGKRVGFSTISEKKRGKQSFSDIPEKAGKTRDFSVIPRQERKKSGFFPAPEQKRGQREFSPFPYPRQEKGRFSPNTQRLVENFKGFSKVSLEEEPAEEERTEYRFPVWERVDSREISRRVEMESRRYSPNLEEDDW